MQGVSPDDPGWQHYADGKAVATFRCVRCGHPFVAPVAPSAPCPECRADVSRFDGTYPVEGGVFPGVPQKGEGAP